VGPQRVPLRLGLDDLKGLRQFCRAQVRKRRCYRAQQLASGRAGADHGGDRAGDAGRVELEKLR